MIIRRLHIDNFGCFHNFDLELEPGFNHFVWQNEKGKSTLLEFIRRIFWGFPDKRSKLNPYPALGGSGHYGGFLEVICNDGTPLRLERRGERGKLKIITPGGRCEEVSDIGNRTGISETFYRNVCAVTLDELTAFAALDDPEIRNRLYGNALSGGTVSLSDLQDQLAGAADTIFKKRGSNNQLKQLAAEFESSEKRLAEAASAMPAYEKAILAAEKIEKNSDNLKRRIETLQNQIAAAEKVQTGIALRNKLAEDEKEFSQRPRPVTVPEFSEPFNEEPPTPPREPEYPVLPELPEAPASSFLDGRCDVLRAVQVNENDTAALSALLSEKQKCHTQIRTVAFYLCISVLLSLAAVLLPRKLSVPGVLLSILFAGASVFFAAFLFKHFNMLQNCKRRKADLLFRFALNPVLTDAGIADTVQALREFQRERSLYEKKRILFEERKKEVELLSLEYQRARQFYDEKCREFEKRRSAHDQKRLLREKQCRAAAIELAVYEKEKLTLIKRRNELEELYSLPSEPYSLDADVPALKEELSRLQKELENNILLSGAERREAALLVKGRDSAVELNIREQLRGKMRSAAEKYLILTAARIILERAVERSERKHQPGLLQKASFYLTRLTQHSCTRVYKSVVDNALMVSGTDFPASKNVSQLSRGTREQLFLALRLALIASFDNGAESLPIVFDDVLVNFDSCRQKAARETLEEFAKERQLIIFECH